VATWSDKKVGAVLVALLLLPVGSLAERSKRSPGAEADGPATRPATALEQAEAALASGRFEAAAEIAGGVGSDHPQAARARFVEGYAHYKLGRVERAAELLQRSLALQYSPEVAFLNGVVYFELRRWIAVERCLEPLVSAKQPPWAELAREMMGRAKQQAEGERQAAARRLHAGALQRAKNLLQEGRYPDAGQALAAAEGVAPGHVLNQYYLGYLAYQTGDYAAARRRFEDALRRDPHDQWSRYMLALSLDDGDPDKKKMLALLAAEGSDAAVREAARQALEIRPTQPSPRGISVLLEVGAGLDTNPGQVTTAGTPLVGPGPAAPIDRPLPPQNGSPAPETAEVGGAAMALRGTMDLGYQRRLAPDHLVAVGLRFFEQAYAVGGEDLAQTELAAWVEYGLRLGRLDLGLSYGYTFDLLGHTPLLSLHDLRLHAGMSLRPWLQVVAGAGLRWRAVHDEAYQHLQALEVGGFLGLRAQWTPVALQAAYHVLGSFGDPATVIVAERNEPGAGLRTTTYRTNYSFLAHGPRFEAEVSLPWRISFSLWAGLLWHTFDDPDRFEVQPTGEVIWQQSRQDLQIVAATELKRPLSHGLELALVFSTVDNVSSLDPSSPVNRSYSRRLLLGSVRWRWPLR
jgi:tetratricopeptide (TPR) repeat protein